MTERWLRIGEVARRTGLTHRTLRHYDDIDLLTPSGRTDGDYRLYSEEDLQRLLAIQNLKSLGLSLTEIAAALDEGLDAAELLGRHAAVLEQRIAEEQRLLATLRHLQGTADVGWEEVLSAIELTERLRHPDPAVRFRAALTEPELAPVEVLIELLSDPVAGVREGATWAVSQRPGVREELVSHMLRGDARTRLSLAHALGKLRDQAAVPVLSTLLSDEDERVATKAAFSLGQVGGSDAARALGVALGDHRLRVREEASASLARVDGALPILTAALASPDPRTREQAADALGVVADEASVEALVAALGDPEEPVRFAALVALGEVGGPTALRAVARAVDSPDRHTRLLARRLATKLSADEPLPGAQAR